MGFSEGGGAGVAAARAVSEAREVRSDAFNRALGAFRDVSTALRPVYVYSNVIIYRSRTTCHRGLQELSHSEDPRTVTVAGKASLEVPPGTLNSILKQAGLKRP
jgi:hypothetical protein